MTDAGYAVTLFDPTKEAIDFGEVPDSFTVEYFVEKFREKWTQGVIRNPSEYLLWSIPELDSGDEDNDFSGMLTYEDKGITFNLAPYPTVVKFVQWIRSIVSSENKVYLLKIPDLEEKLEITQATNTAEIFDFLKHR